MSGRKSKNILIFYPYNFRTVEQQSVMEMLYKNGNKVFLLTLDGIGELHSLVESVGIKSFSTRTGLRISFWNILVNVVKIIRICYAHKIDVIFAHQQVCMLPLIIAKPIIFAKKYYFRHNTDEGYQYYGFKLRALNKFINRFSKFIIAPSEIVKRFLIDKEQVSKEKIIRINYGYNFDLYDKPVASSVQEIRNKYKCQLLLISIARLVPAKRHLMMFEVLKKLVDQRLNVKLICLGAGTHMETYRTWIVSNHLEGHIFLLGRQNNIFDYLCASDVLIHLSESEASNSVVKEAALAGIPAIVCKEVGDFQDYVIDGKNGFLVDKIESLEQAFEKVMYYYQNIESIKLMGIDFNGTVKKEFNIKNVEKEYFDLLNK